VSDGELIVTMRDIRVAKMCSSGARLFWERNGLDWTHFLDHGIPASTLLATGDENAAIVVEVARGRQ